MNMPLVLLNRRRRAGGFSPYVALFANDERGVFLDPSDTANLSWRRNLLTFTEQFDNAAWTATRATVSANSDVAPNGTTTADKLVPNTDNNTHFINRTLNLVGTYTLSAFFKASGYSRVLFSDGSGLAKGLDVDIQNGTIVSTGSSVSNGFVQAVGNGWFRVSFTITDVLGFTTFIDNGSGLTFAGNGTSGILIWGAQLEVGSTASTYQVITDLNTEVRANFPNATLYQDTAGTTPVTTPGQSVALALDKSRGLVRGPELAQSLVGYANGTAVTSIPNWNINSTPVVADVQDGALRVTADSAGDAARLTITTVAGRTYQVSFNYTGTGSSNVFVNGPSLTFSSNTAVFVATGSSDFVFFRPNGNLGSGTGVWSNISVRELPGNHATQATSGSRPLYALLPANGVRNLANGSASVGDVNFWSASQVISGITAARVASGIDVDGLPYFDVRMTGTATGASRDIAYLNGASRQAASVGQSFTASVTAQLIAGSATGISGVQVASVEETAPSTFVNLAGSALTVSTSETLLSATRTIATGNQARCAVVLVMNNGATIDVTYRIKALQFELGTARTAYQFNYANTNIAQPPFAQVGALLFDGVDDFLQTPSVGFSATDKMTVFAGVRKLSDAANGLIAELSVAAGSNPGTFALLSSVGGATYTFRSSGSLLTSLVTTSTSFAAPLTNVLTGVADISADVDTLRVNGVQAVTASTDQGTGNYGNYPIYIGRRAGTSTPFNGYLYSLIVRGAATSADLITLTERWVNSRTGAY